MPVIPAVVVMDMVVGDASSETSNPIQRWGGREGMRVPYVQADRRSKVNARFGEGPGGDRIGLTGVFEHDLGSGFAQPLKPRAPEFQSMFHPEGNARCATKIPWAAQVHHKVLGVYIVAKRHRVGNPAGNNLLDKMVV